MKHVSIRVAWHDKSWKGTVCDCPIQNSYCAQLKRISESKDIDKENAVATKKWSALPFAEMPPCVAEAGGFMNEENYKRLFVHVYAREDRKARYPKHSVLEPTEDNVPAFSFYGTPFRYMLCQNQNKLDEKYPDLPKDERNPYPSPWIFGSDRQKAILKHFMEQIDSNSSLVVFYSKNGNPIDEDCKRLIIGIGEIAHLYPINYYNSRANYTYPFWDIKMSHSIRPNLDESNGFLLPYHEYLKMNDDDIYKKTKKTKAECIDEIKITLHKLGGSQQMLDQLSYGCEHINDHNMLIILNAARHSIENVIAHGLIGGNWQKQLRWIDDQLAKVKQQMGPFPAFAEALRAAGFNYSYMIEQDLRNKGFCKPKDNPWLLFEDLLSGRINMGKTAYSHLIKTYHKDWQNTGLKQKEILQLLSRINLSDEQIRRIYNSKDRNYFDSIIQNPYILSEDCVPDTPFDTITTEMIDEGFMADPGIQGNYPPTPPSLVDDPTDKRRIRAIIVERLKNALEEGDTLLSQIELEDYLDEYLLVHDSARITKGFLDTNKTFIEQKISFIENEENEFALQLSDYEEKEQFVSRKFEKRAKKRVKYEIKEDWEKIIRSTIKGFKETDHRSAEAVKDQARALDIMSNYRLSVLTGPAGTGKTKVVEAFLKSSTIKKQGVLLLAPTGKARVRLGRMAGIKAITIAQFLIRQNCFNPKTMRPFWDDHKSQTYSEASTVIIDECSMLTIDDFYYVLKALNLSTVHRIILIGDPYQLPPIGPGRPFADLCTFLEKNNYSSLARLNIVVRTTANGESDILKLASWYSGMKPDKSADDIFNRMASGKLEKDLSVYTWKDTDDLRQQIINVLASDFKIPQEDIPSYIERILGISAQQLESTFNDPDVLESFQLLSPVKHPLWGTYSLNSIIQKMLGTPNTNDNRKNYITVDGQRIYVRDKVIQLINERKEPYPNPNNVQDQLSNGQIGFVKSYYSGWANVAFAGLPSKTFGYSNQEAEMRDASIELAYAITIHKSQGSDFENVMVVLPKTGKLLSRELIYTALTRSKNRLILFVEEDTNWIRSLSSPIESIVATRNTNLFDSYAFRKTRKSLPFVEGLIHQTVNNIFVRSKSEVIIANLLYSKKVPFSYEEVLIFDDGSKCWPDFTFTSESGDKIILEHLGMLRLPEYKEHWDDKYKRYIDNGFKLNVDLFITKDEDDGSISTPDILKVIDKIIDRIDD